MFYLAVRSLGQRADFLVGPGAESWSVYSCARRKFKQGVSVWSVLMQGETGERELLCKLLTKRITQVPNFDALVELCKNNMESFNFINTSAAMHALSVQCAPGFYPNNRPQGRGRSVPFGHPQLQSASAQTHQYRVSVRLYSHPWLQRSAPVSLTYASS